MAGSSRDWATPDVRFCISAVLGPAPRSASFEREIRRSGYFLRKGSTTDTVATRTSLLGQLPGLWVVQAPTLGSAPDMETTWLALPKRTPTLLCPHLLRTGRRQRAHATSLLILIQSQFCKGRLVVDSDRSRLESDNYPFSMGRCVWNRPNPAFRYAFKQRETH